MDKENDNLFIFLAQKSTIKHILQTFTTGHSLVKSSQMWDVLLLSKLILWIPEATQTRFHRSKHVIHKYLFCMCEYYV